MVDWDELVKRLVVNVREETIFCYIPHVGEVQSKDAVQFLDLYTDGVRAMFPTLQIFCFYLVDFK